jgi:hypothetical protein
VARKRTNCRMRQPKTGPNKTEQEYLDLLEHRRQAGEILWYGFERMKLKLANNTFYTPDVLLLTASGELEFHEIKGFWEDDARVKIKVAAEDFPFIRFVAVKKLAKKNGGGWETEEF